ncbi:hypothetical protein IAQ61_003104 [Plenodomus lingam]|uniref:uncharacterized protein n=1 Tax=Leptosphaeria maculans TaxID=5022 RepID=UPI00331BD64A|nr:hypothetical protein IAQ61_003104 [Plenodomus lingam]
MTAKSAVSTMDDHWKRYNGGVTQHVGLLQGHQSKRITGSFLFFAPVAPPTSSIYARFSSAAPKFVQDRQRSQFITLFSFVVVALRAVGLDLHKFTSGTSFRNPFGLAMSG